MDTQNSSLKLWVFVSQDDPVSSWNMVWKDYQGQAWLSLCIPGLRDVVSIFCWFCEAVAPGMQDIRWGWNILKDWKLERGTAICASYGKSRSSDRRCGWSAWHTAWGRKQAWTSVSRISEGALFLTSWL